MDKLKELEILRESLNEGFEDSFDDNETDYSEIMDRDDSDTLNPVCMGTNMNKREFNYLRNFLWKYAKKFYEPGRKEPYINFPQDINAVLTIKVNNTRYKIERISIMTDIRNTDILEFMYTSPHATNQKLWGIPDAENQSCEDIDQTSCKITANWSKFIKTIDDIVTHKVEESFDSSFDDDETDYTDVMQRADEIGVIRKDIIDLLMSHWMNDSMTYIEKDIEDFKNDRRRVEDYGGPIVNAMFKAASLVLWADKEVITTMIKYKTEIESICSKTEFGRNLFEYFNREFYNGSYYLGNPDRVSMKGFLENPDDIIRDIRLKPENYFDYNLQVNAYNLMFALIMTLGGIDLEHYNPDIYWEFSHQLMGAGAKKIIKYGTMLSCQMHLVLDNEDLLRFNDDIEMLKEYFLQGNAMVKSAAETILIPNIDKMADMLAEADTEIESDELKEWDPKEYDPLDYEDDDLYESFEDSFDDDETDYTEIFDAEDQDIIILNTAGDLLKQYIKSESINYKCIPWRFLKMMKDPDTSKRNKITAITNYSSIDGICQAAWTSNFLGDCAEKVLDDPKFISVYEGKFAQVVKAMNMDEYTSPTGNDEDVVFGYLVDSMTNSVTREKENGSKFKKYMMLSFFILLSQMRRERKTWDEFLKTLRYILDNTYGQYNEALTVHQIYNKFMWHYDPDLQFITQEFTGLSLCSSEIGRECLPGELLEGFCWRYLLSLVSPQIYMYGTDDIRHTIMTKFNNAEQDAGIHWEVF